jgi:hypothetical protein
MPSTRWLALMSRALSPLLDEFAVHQRPQTARQRIRAVECVGEIHARPAVRQGAADVSRRGRTIIRRLGTILADIPGQPETRRRDLLACTEQPPFVSIGVDQVREALEFLPLCLVLCASKPRRIGAEARRL